jgi:hypothetical protein
MPHTVEIRELGPSGRRDLASTAAVVGKPGPCESGVLKTRMTSLQPFLELDRHKHAYLAGLIDRELGNVTGLHFLLVHPQSETDVGGGGRPVVRHRHGCLNPLETLGLASASGQLDHDLGTAKLGLEPPTLRSLSNGQREANHPHDDSDNPEDNLDLHSDGLPDLLARETRFGSAHRLLQTVPGT